MQCYCDLAQLAMPTNSNVLLLTNYFCRKKMNTNVKRQKQQQSLHLITSIHQTNTYCTSKHVFSSHSIRTAFNINVSLNITFQETEIHTYKTFRLLCNIAKNTSVIIPLEFLEHSHLKLMSLST